MRIVNGTCLSWNDLISGQTVPARHMYGSEFDFRSQVKLVGGVFSNTDLVQSVNHAAAQNYLNSQFSITSKQNRSRRGSNAWNDQSSIKKDRFDSLDGAVLGAYS